MKQRFHVKFTARFETTIEVDTDVQTISDAVADIEIPETADIQYLPQTFQLDSVQDERGKEVSA